MFDTQAEQRQRLIALCDERREIAPLEDGYQYYFAANNGALSATNLRWIADELDARNAAWDEIVRNDMSEQETMDTPTPNPCPRCGSTEPFIMPNKSGCTWLAFCGESGQCVDNLISFARSNQAEVIRAWNDYAESERMKKKIGQWLNE